MIEDMESLVGKEVDTIDLPLITSDATQWMLLRQGRESLFEPTEFYLDDATRIDPTKASLIFERCCRHRPDYGLTMSFVTRCYRWILTVTPMNYVSPDPSPRHFHGRFGKESTL